jgi:hypothetical protein
VSRVWQQGPREACDISGRNLSLYKLGVGPFHNSAHGQTVDQIFLQVTLVGYEGTG